MRKKTRPKTRTGKLRVVAVSRTRLVTPKKRPITLASALDIIDQLLCHVHIGKDLANILSALRGPDDEDYDTKAATTCRVRRLAFPKACKKDLTAAHLPWVYTSTKMCPFPILEVGSSVHFQDHIKWARQVLEQLGRGDDAD